MSQFKVINRDYLCKTVLNGAKNANKVAQLVLLLDIVC